jgi:hypothetical protein
MPQLEKVINSNEMEVGFVGEVLRDHKLVMPKLKKDTTDQVTEWPILTLEQDYSENEVCSTHNLVGKI